MPLNILSTALAAVLLAACGATQGGRGGPRGGGVDGEGEAALNVPPHQGEGAAEGEGEDPGEPNREGEEPPDGPPQGAEGEGEDPGAPAGEGEEPPDVPPQGGEGEGEGDPNGEGEEAPDLPPQGGEGEGEDPGEPDPAVEGACTNAADQAVFDTHDPREATSGCAFECIMQPEDRRGECFRACMQRDLPLSDGCANCFFLITSCVMGSCLPGCMAPDSDDCQACMEEQGCNAEFEECSGLDPSQG